MISSFRLKGPLSWQIRYTDWLRSTTNGSATTPPSCSLLGEQILSDWTERALML